ncbi:porphobilinogen synthase [uncultured Clostridium sp.]|uniref:porphobilinogen synthase n=1 Tax=uncultured Clostridium sp. TaxID=59620 RepID=UPI0025995F4C|nr:porphobilinogen synthase [uncultured Clostridium sp.]
MFRRGRRLRTNSVIRNLVRENSLSVDDFIYPVFVVEGNNIKREISSLKGNYHWSVDKLDELVKELNEAKVKSVILFGIPDHKDCVGSEAYNDNGIVQKAIRRLKELNSNLYIITDVCMCEYTDHGHCGILDNHNVNNDKTLVYLGEIALSHAKAGADMVAPSDMMDGRIGYIREVLDKNGFESLPIMSYAAKYSSAFYGPFREAAGSAPSFGDRKGYQMDPANSREAMAEIEADLNEGADVIMVKPAMSYLDIVKEARDKINTPICVYNVSGEYAMVKNAGEAGLINEKLVALEMLLSMKRAGAKMIITYYALEAAKWLKEDE